jgi:hypothetical protein
MMCRKSQKQDSPVQSDSHFLQATAASSFLQAAQSPMLEEVRLSAAGCSAAPLSGFASGPMQEAGGQSAAVLAVQALEALH